MEQLLANLYQFKCYIQTDNPIQITEDKPSGPWIRFTLRELAWWEYDNIIAKTFTKTQDTYEWTINSFMKKRLLLKEGLQRIEEWDNENIVSYDEDCYDLLPDTYGELLCEYYDNKVTISVEEIINLESQIRSYMDPSEINVIKPPYDRMIVELDIARRLGGYNRKDILSMSKKEMDKIFILGRLGLKIPFQQSLNDISSENGLNGIQDQELLDLAHQMIDFSPPPEFRKKSSEMNDAI